LSSRILNDQLQLVLVLGPQVLVLVLGPQILVLVLEPQAKSSKIIVKDFAFCKQFVMYDHVKSINPCMKNGLLTDVKYYLLIDVK